MLDREFYRRLEDLIQRNLQKDVPLHTGFLDPATQREALRLCRKRGCEGELWGGYAGAERKVLFLPATYQEAPDHSVVACIRLQSKGVFAHPDLLGALMAMGTKRDCIGDLCIVQDKNGGSEARAYCLATMAPHLAAITSVGRSAVEVEVMPLLGEQDEQEREEGGGDGRRIKVSLASLRADNVLAAAFKLPRSRAATLFEAQHVQLNWRICMDRSKILQIGDVLSVRHHGRVVIENVGGKSRKERSFVTLMVYG